MGMLENCEELSSKIELYSLDIKNLHTKKDECKRQILNQIFQNLDICHMWDVEIDSGRMNIRSGLPFYIKNSLEQCGILSRHTFWGLGIYGYEGTTIRLPMWEVDTMGDMAELSVRDSEVRIKFPRGPGRENREEFPREALSFIIRRELVLCMSREDLIFRTRSNRDITRLISIKEI